MELCDVVDLYVAQAAVTLHWATELRQRLEDPIMRDDDPAGSAAMLDLRSIGFITMAFGKERYLEQARTLARSLKRAMPGHPIAIVTDRTAPGPMFDIVVPMEAVAQAGTVHKTAMYRYSPFQETLFIDSDCVAVRDFSEQLRAIRTYDFSPVVNRYLHAGDRDLWLDDVGFAIAGVNGTGFPKFNGGVYFFRKSAFAEEVFARSEAIRDRQADLGIRDFDRSGPGEETLIGLALSQMHVTNLYDDDGRLMRTPLNSSGGIEADPFLGYSRFIKEGALVEPAIIHYCGEWIDHPTYLIAARGLRAGRRSGVAVRGAIRARHVSRILARRVRRRLTRI